jgi:hypothetical protein
MKLIPLKQLLRTTVIPELFAHTAYFSTGEIRAALRRRRVAFKPATLNRYLHELTQAGYIHDAGRGWYSSLPERFSLDPAPVEPVVESLTKQFPLVRFSCWSTQQINGYMHHMLARFATFVYVPRAAMKPVFQFLRDQGYHAYLNPTRKEAAKNFTIREKTIVVRPSLRKQPADTKFAPIEKLLVDIYVESEALAMMDRGEFERMAKNVIRSARVSVPTVIAYSDERQVPIRKLFTEAQSIISD